MRKQILLIDDDLPLCRKLREALQDDTTEVRYFIDTAEALDSFMRHRYCLVIIDPELEDMDGRELLRTMRQAKAAPILVLTDTLSPEDEVAILSSGATVYAQKPIDGLLRPMLSSASIGISQQYFLKMVNNCRPYDGK